MLSIRKQKKISNPFRIRLFFSLSYSFGIQTIKYVPRLRRSLENHTRFQTKMGKVYTRFHTKRQNGAKTLPAGAGNTGIHRAKCATHANDYALDWRCETGERSPLAARVRACTLSLPKFKYQHVVWRNPIKRIRKYSNDFRDAVYSRQHIHSRFTYTLLYEIYCGLRKF